MAKAPPPGKTINEASRRFRITLGGETRELSLTDLGPGDDLVARQQTGIPVQPFFEEDRFGPDSLLILWWMARRKNGEKRLKFSEVLAEFPSYAAIEAADPEMVMVEDDSPEA
jgi:hypothetical protein